MVRTGDYYGRSEVTERDESNKALRQAAKQGKTEIVRVLMDDPRSDPSATNNFALKWAIKGGYDEIIDMLMGDERVQDKLHLLPMNAQKKLKEWELMESVEFERGKDPKEAMKIGAAALKVFRCGHCGSPTDEFGTPLKFDSPEFQKTVDIIEKMNDETTEYMDCDTCISEFESESRQREEEYERQAEAQAEWEQTQNDAEENYYGTH